MNDGMERAWGVNRCVWRSLVAGWRQCGGRRVEAEAAE
jgi:hypothetical protein